MNDDYGMTFDRCGALTLQELVPLMPVHNGIEDEERS